MKYPIIGIATLASTLAFASQAQANNTTVENALKSRPELSTFYSGLLSTGVLNELKPDQPYTVFAPTNQAFAAIPQDKYSCFYSVTCKAQVAAVLRKHIVPGEKHLSDMNPEAGVLSLFSVDNQHIVGSEPSKGKFQVDGKDVVSENQLLGGDLYIINGVMASDHDLAQFATPEVVVVKAPNTDLPPRVPQGEIVTVTTDATKPIPY